MIRFFATAAVMLALPLVASAHAVGIEAKLKGKTVAIEAYFDDDTPAADAKITVEDESKKVIAEGTTDAKGGWSFPVPQPGKYTVLLDAGFGHSTKTTITVPVLFIAKESGDGSAHNDSDSMTGQAPEVSISEGLSRSSFTGSMRAVMASVGLAIIALATGLIWWLTRKRSPKGSS